MLFWDAIFVLTILFSWQTNSPLFLEYWRPLYYMITITTDLCPSSSSRKKFSWVNLPNRIFLSRHHDLFSCHPNSMGYFSKWYCKPSFPSCIDSTEKERWPRSMDFYYLTAIVWIFVSFLLLPHFSHGRSWACATLHTNPCTNTCVTSG